MLANEAPTAAISIIEPTPSTGETIYVSAYPSSDPEDDLLTYRWEIVSHPPEALIPPYDPDTESPVWYFIPDVVGDYVIKLTITDSWGGSDSVTQTITLTP